MHSIVEHFVFRSLLAEAHSTNCACSKFAYASHKSNTIFGNKLYKTGYIFLHNITPIYNVGFSWDRMLNIQFPLRKKSTLFIEIGTGSVMADFGRNILLFFFSADHSTNCLGRLLDRMDVMDP